MIIYFFFSFDFFIGKNTSMRCPKVKLFFEKILEIHTKKNNNKVIRMKTPLFKVYKMK